MAATKIPIELSSTPGIVDNSNATAITIDSNEKVGIGTSSPTDTLSVGTLGSGTPTITIGSGTANSGYLYFGDGTGADRYRGFLQYAHSTDSLQFGSAGSEKMRIDSSGNVGIGTSSPTGKLEIAATGTNAAPHIKLVESGDTREFNIYNDGSGNGRLVLADTDDTPDTEIVLADNGVIQFKTANTERAIIDASGNVGIGTSGPDYLLHLHNDSQNSYLYMSGGGGLGESYGGFIRGYGVSGSGGYLDLGVNDGGALRTSINIHPQGNYLIFSTAGTERMRLDSAGTLAMGGTNASPQPGENIAYHVATDGYALYSGVNATTSRNHAVFGNPNGYIGSIVTSGSTTTYNTGSDYRLKENIQPLANGLERLQQLNPVQFNWKADGTSSEGFIAHEVQEIFPDAVSGEKDGEKMQGMDYGKITPLLTKAIQEQQTLIEELKTRIETLENS